MTIRSGARFVLLLLLVAASLGAVHPPSSAGASAAARQSTSPFATWSGATGTATFLRAPAGQVLATPAGASPEARAYAYLSAEGAALGLTGIDRAGARTAATTGRWPATGGSALEVADVVTDDLGLTHVTLQQTYAGVPVRAAELRVHLSAEGVTAVDGRYVPKLRLDATPRISRDDAVAAATAFLHELEPDTAELDLTVADARLEVYRDGMFQGAPGANHLAWYLELTADNLRDQLWVDAHTADVVTRIGNLHHAKDRCVYSPQYDPNNPDAFKVREEGDGPTFVPPVDNLYRFSGQVYDMFDRAFGRDSWDGAGAKMITVYLINDVCPNAYWNGQSTNYCPGFDVDDVVAHEWGHAYTEATHGLIYAWQPGALNESYSDIFGEVIDLINEEDGIGGSNNEQPYPDGQRWLVGEDLGEELQQLLLRDMWDPERLGDPATVTSDVYVCGTGDNGGVHTNSGVPNHAFAMLVDGKEFNGQVVEPIGLDEATAIYYRAMTTYQSQATSFAEHAQALRQSCADLIGQTLRSVRTGDPLSRTLTATDCAQVDAAMLATEMDVAPTQCGFTPQLSKDAPALCPGATEVFADDFEDGLGDWELVSEGVYPEWPGYNWVTEPELPGGRAGTGAFAIDEREAGTCAPGGDVSGVFGMITPEITAPDPADEILTLRFDHYVETEVTWDGGNVKYQVNGGAWEVLPQGVYTFNPPISPLEASDNPNGGQFAWHGADGGSVRGSWGTTVADLSSLVSAGDTVRLRFDMGIDGCNGVTGWFVDDVFIHTCPNLEAPTLAIGDDYEDPDTDGSFTLTWERPAGGVGPDTVQVSTIDPVPLADDAESGLDKWTATNTGSGAGTWRTTNEKPNTDGMAFGVRGQEGSANVAAYLTTATPLVLPEGRASTLRFEDWFMGEGDDLAAVQVSADGGETWENVYTFGRSALADEGLAAYQSEAYTPRTVDLSAYAGAILMRFAYQLGPDNRAGSTPLGWYVDNIRVTTDAFEDLRQVGATSLTIDDQPVGTRWYRTRTAYAINEQFVQGPHGNIVAVTVETQPNTGGGSGGGEATTGAPEEPQPPMPATGGGLAVLGLGLVAAAAASRRRW